MARNPKTVSDIDLEIETLKEKRKDMLEKQSIAIGKIATKAGLNELDITDAELLLEFEAIASRFRNKKTPPSTNPN